MKPSLADFPCNHCVNPLCIAKPCSCRHIEEIKEWREDVEAALRASIAFYKGRPLNEYEMARVATLKELLGEAGAP
jgi:hypothetical protein